MLTGERVLSETGIDAVALKPARFDVRRATALPVDRVTIDYEGRDHVPSRETLSDLAESKHVRLTVPVRADGFDPLGNDALLGRIPGSVDRVLVAGHPAYLAAHERRRAIAPRLGAALERWPDAWVGTEGIERLALATGATQFELLCGTTEGSIRAMRAVGFGGEVVVYAPTVPSEEPNEILDAIGAYVARRGPIAGRLPDGAMTDRRATGNARSVLLQGTRAFGLVGSTERIAERVKALKDAGADAVVGYPARGMNDFIE